MVAASDPLEGFAVHFTRGADPVAAAAARAAGVPKGNLVEALAWLDATDTSGYRSSLSILWEGHVRPTRYPMGVAAHVTEVAERNRSACFSESPLNDLKRLIETRSLYGVGFEQTFLEIHGGERVLYVPPGSDEEISWRRAVADACVGGVDPTDPLWQMTPFVDILDPTRDMSWEKEWRVPGGLNFKPSDVAFVFLPEELHGRARDFFEEHRVANTGPAYFGVYLDPRWERDRIEEALWDRVP
jgi:hypothetical protein